MHLSVIGRLMGAGMLLGAFAATAEKWAYEWINRVEFAEGSHKARHGEQHHARLEKVLLPGTATARW